MKLSIGVKRLSYCECFLLTVPVVYMTRLSVCLVGCQELKVTTADSRHRVDELLGLSQSMLSIIKDSPTKSGVKQKLQQLHSSLDNIDSQLGECIVHRILLSPA